MVPKMALIWGNGGLNVRFYDRDPEKAHPCAEPRVVAYVLCTIIDGTITLERRLIIRIWLMPNWLNK